MNKAVPMDQLVDMVMAELEKKLSASKAADNPAAIRSMNPAPANETASPLKCQLPNGRKG